jgi:hypothetical protein
VGRQAKSVKTSIPGPVGVWSTGYCTMGARLLSARMPCEPAIYVFFSSRLFQEPTTDSNNFASHFSSFILRTSTVSVSNS